MKEYIKTFFLIFIKYFFVAIGIWFLFAIIYTIGIGFNDFLNLINDFNKYNLELYLFEKIHLQNQINVYFIIFLISFGLVLVSHYFLIKKKI